VGLVLWIDQNTFATGLLEKVFKKKNLPFYTLASAADFLYLVEDLGPRCLVLDSKTILTDLEKFKTQYESEKLQNLPVILLDPVPELSFIKNVQGEIVRPFDPFNIPDRLFAILKAN
jgi:FixJ family two-component response regulator